MSDIMNNQKIKRKPRAKKLSTRIDMTPMVDLAFLLLTFFILTTTLQNQNVLTLDMPVEDGPIPRKSVNNAITLILSGHDRIFYYEDELKPETVLKQTSFSEIEKLLKDKNQPAIDRLTAYNKSTSGAQLPDSAKQTGRKKIYESQGINVIIKYDSLATYRNTIDIVDEMEACSVPSGKYAIVKMLEKEEKIMLKRKYN